VILKKELFDGYAWGKTVIFAKKGLWIGIGTGLSMLIAFIFPKELSIFMWLCTT